MPTVYRVDGFRFFFFSNENEEPPHVHVEKPKAMPSFGCNPMWNWIGPRVFDKGT